ncbi:hypothetical protein EC968_005181 [Mortierella alpina]|nr:hypothetical protein EC968_005181 [Mortierella alpina]
MRYASTNLNPALHRTICANQQRKAVRLNTAVLHELEYQGVDIGQYFPIIAEGRGLCLSFYTLKRTGEVITAGKSTNTVAWIPSHLLQLKQFFKSDCMHVLLKFADHTIQYAEHVQDTLSFRPRPSLPSTPPPRFKAPFAALTLHKHNKRKSMEEADEHQDEEEYL